MSQHDYILDNGTGAAFRADGNLLWLAMASMNSGSSVPSTVYANQMWLDTSTDIVYMRNEANDANIELFSLDQTNGVVVFLRAIDKIVISTADVVKGVLYDTSKDSYGGAWRDRVSHTSLGKPPAFMDLTVEGAATDTVTVRDLTDPDTPIWKAWNLTNPTSVDARDGKIIIGTSAGVVVIDLVADEVLNYDATDLSRADQSPADFDMSTVTWLSVSTDGAIVNATVNDVAITVLPGAPIDTATGLPIPTRAAATDGGVSVINNDGNVFDSTDTTSHGGIEFLGTILFWSQDTNSNTRYALQSAYTANDGFGSGVGNYHTGSIPTILASTSGNDNSLSEIGISIIALGITNGLNIIAHDPTTQANGMVAYITKDYNTGWMPGDIRGAWLANSKTADRSVKGNTLTEGGTVTEAAVATGAELKGYSGWSASNKLTRASGADWDVIGTGAVTLSIWFKTAGNSAIESYTGFENAANNRKFLISMAANGILLCLDSGASGSEGLVSAVALDDGILHKIDFVRISSTSRILYVDGNVVDTGTVDTGSLSSSGNLPLAIGVDSDGSSTPATSSTLALARLTAYAPSAAQIKFMYEWEKFLFVDNADALFSGSSNAVASVDYDEDSDLLLVGTGDGTSFFRGLERVKYVDLSGTPTNDAIVSVSAVRGVYLIGTGAETVYNESAHILREDEIKVDRDTQPPEIILIGSTTDATASVVVAALPIYEGESATITLTVDTHEPTLPGGENATYEIIANVYRTVGGNITVQGQTAVSTIESTGSMACVVAANTTDQTLEVQVTGVAATTLKWTTRINVVGNVDRWAR